MSDYVIDASVAAKWFIEEEYARNARLLRSEDNALHAPDFFLLEMDNVVTKWIRRGIVAAEHGSDIRTALRRYPMRYYRFPFFLDDAFDVAVRTGRSIYDCLYVVLAVGLDVRMVTADRRLVEALSDGPLSDHLLHLGDLK